jgi:hypothetical protein
VSIIGLLRCPTKTKKEGEPSKKATTLAELRRRLDERDGYLSPADGQALVDAVSESRKRERDLGRGRKRGKKTRS